MEKKKIILLCILCLIVGIVIFFLPNIYKFVETKKAPNVNEEIVEEEEEQLEKLTIESDVIKNLKYPIMRYSIYSSNSYYEKSDFKVSYLTNEEILINAFVDIYEGNIGDYNGSKPDCASEAKELKSSYINSRIKNILGNNVKYNHADFNVLELSNYSKYLGSWKYNSATDTYIYYGSCTNQSGTKYYDLKILNKVEAKDENKEVSVYAYMGFAKVENSKYIIYSDAAMSNKIKEGAFTTLANLNKEFEEYLKNNKTKQYKFMFKKGICSYGDYCLEEGAWVNE